ncbi:MULTISPECIES: hypothetical protein [Streptomyces]|uniref:hypothetical protein n=1 Tax=Streptomyces TaxID=1883 RepID=UPI00210CDB43|nr:hypothetical protein [Streptomyces longispororuber]MCQ4214534.1 hypothetical protein [Streptomyces longispororuber]
MKPLLWLILAAALITNVSTSFALDGVQQVLVSIGTGVATLTAAGVLFATRRRAGA